MRWLACLLLAALPPAALAAGGAEPLVRQAEARGLATHPYWLALLQYARRAPGEPRAAPSEILSEDFFLSPQGRADPAAELAATLTAFFAAPGEAPDEHAQCRFVARFKWLRATLDWRGLEPPAVSCPRYLAYTLGNQVESLSLVYATGYFSNPGSSFGHMLLKFNFRRTAVAADLLDQSVSFGAAIPRNENPAAYVLKGLFGGYDGVFSHQQFYSFHHAYAELELRDLWEYELRFDADEVERIVAHSWELLGRRYAYFFLKENCAYRMAQLLELALDEPLLPGLPWALPGTLFERIAAVKRGGVPLVRAVHRIASRQNRFREKYLALPGEQRALASALVGNGLDLGAAAYQRQPEAEKVEVVDTLLDYYEYRGVLDRSDPAPRAARQKLLAERLQLPEDAPRSDAAVDPRPPHEGALPFLASAGALHNTRFGGGAALRLRPVNHDQLSPDAGRIPYSSLALLDLRVVLLDGRLRLRRFDLIDVESLSVARTPLPADGGVAGRLGAGLASQDLACSGCTVMRLVGGLGKAWPLGGQAAAFGMVDASAQSRHEGAGTFAATPRVGLTGTAVPGWKTYLSVGWLSYAGDTRANSRVVRWENRLGTSRRWDLRLTYEEHVAREAGAALSLYW